VSTIWPVPLFASIVASLLLAGVILLKRRHGAVGRFLIVVLGAMAWIQTCTALGLVDSARMPTWKHMALFGEIVFPIALFKVSASFINEKEKNVALPVLWRFRALAGLGLVCTIFLLVPFGIPGGISDSTFSGTISSAFGKFIGIFILVSLVMALAQLEQVLRASRDPLRYQIKFVVMGLGGLAGFSILQASGLEVFAGWSTEYAFASGMVTLLSVGLMAYGFGRWHLQDINRVVYISPQALYTSLTFLIVGGYFIVVGGLGEIVRRTGWEMGDALGLLLVFIAVMGLVAIIFSRQARAELRLFIAKHFYRSKYDYRLKWFEVMDAFRACDSVNSILDNFLELLIQTFGAERVTIWLAYEADGRFHQVRSTDLQSPPDPLEAAHPLVVELLASNGIVELSPAEETTRPVWNPFMQATQAVLCVPLRTPDELHGFVTLSQEFGNDRYRQDDFDLLRSITHYVTIQLSQAKLTEARTAAAKWEAVSRFAAFYLHDLKTLVAGLSLVTQNAQVHGKDPAFQESAMQTVTNTVRKMTGVINKLSSQARSLANPDPESFHRVNINDVIVDAIHSLKEGIRKPVLSMASSLSPVSIAPNQFKQLLMNLVLNARQSAGENGEIRITTEQVNGAVSVTIADSGSGIPDSQLRTLFQPFQTTKPDGFGLGLYQCKAIIEQSRGKIRVESQEGQGTHISITLPAA